MAGIVPGYTNSDVIYCNPRRDSLCSEEAYSYYGSYDDGDSDDEWIPPNVLLTTILSNKATHNCDKLGDIDGLTLVMFFLENMYSDPTIPLPVCMSNNINMSFYYVNEYLEDIPYLSGITDPAVLRDKIAKLKAVGVKSYLNYETIERWIDMWLGPNSIAFEFNKKRFRECKFPYIFVPLGLMSFASSYHRGHHQNGILIRKNGTVFRIEPDSGISEDDEIQNKINEGVLEIAKKIGLASPTLIPITQICPQAITKDQNCIFWTIFICNEIMRNVFKYSDPNEIIKIYSSKPKEELEKLISDFKVELVRKIIPEGLEKLGCEWEEFNRFTTDFPDYAGGKRRVRKTKKRRLHRKKNKKNKKRKRRTLRKK